MALLGGLVGAFVGPLALRVLVAIAPVGVPRLAEVAMDMPVFVITLGVTMMIGLCRPRSGPLSGCREAAPERLLSAAGIGRPACRALDVCLF